MKARIKTFLFGLLGKDPEAVIIHIHSGDPAAAARMSEEVRLLVPDRRHVVVTPEDLPSGASAWAWWKHLSQRFRRARTGLMPVLFDGDPRYASLRRGACLFAPRRVLAYNRRLERHHLKVSTALASLLFLRGVPAGRIFLRPRWFPSRKKISATPASGLRTWHGREASAERAGVAVLTPYLPYPLSHGGAVRIFHVLRQAAREFDLYLYAFGESNREPDPGPLVDFCTAVTVIPKTPSTEPRWSTLLPPEVHEFESPAMRQALERGRGERRFQLLQVEYTQLARYEGDILVEHDVTFDLYRQIHERERTASAWWIWRRWRRFERAAVERYRSVIAMSDKDRELLGGGSRIAVIPNGVDLERFRPELERPGSRLLFIGSFRHFPNMVAFRFFREEVWPRLRESHPDVSITVVAGPDAAWHWREFTGGSELTAAAGITLHEFVADVAPLYVEANLVLVPTLVSAGTNLKVLEALAMERAVVSTSRGCAGLGLQHGRDVWIADGPEEFTAGIAHLLEHPGLRKQIAAHGRLRAERDFGWDRIGEAQRALWRTLLRRAAEIRPITEADLPAVAAIQGTASEASQWKPADYLYYPCHVAVVDGEIAGFLISREISLGEREILNLGVHPRWRRRGIAHQLLQAELVRWPGVHFLEVRESNAAARALYGKLGFEEAGVRPGYYDDPPESGIVMRIRSC